MEGRIANVLNNMVPGPASSATVQQIYASEDGIMLAYGNTIPSDGAAGYAPGCLFIHVDGTTVSRWYGNIGSATSADFNLITCAA